MSKFISFLIFKFKIIFCSENKTEFENFYPVIKMKDAFVELAYVEESSFYLQPSLEKAYFLKVKVKKISKSYLETSGSLTTNNEYEEKIFFIEPHFDNKEILKIVGEDKFDEFIDNLSDKLKVSNIKNYNKKEKLSDLLQRLDSDEDKARILKVCDLLFENPEYLLKKTILLFEDNNEENLNYYFHILDRILQNMTWEELSQWRNHFSEIYLPGNSYYEKFKKKINHYISWFDFKAENIKEFY